MDKNSVGTQYIICECGDNFPNEDLLNIHLANDHESVEVFQCNVCPAVFSTKSQLHNHSRSHEKTKEKSPLINPTAKTNNEKKKPPVIKLQNLKRIDSISLIQSLKSYPGLVKLDPAPVIQEPETCQIRIEEPKQVLVKMEVQEQEETQNEEIYYQCDVCNTIFYTESEFNVHYQSTHAMKVEPTPEEILENHLVTDHILDVNVKAEAAEAVETAYYYECEIARNECSHTTEKFKESTENYSGTTENSNGTIENGNGTIQVEDKTAKNDNETIENANEITENYNGTKIEDKTAGCDNDTIENVNETTESYNGTITNENGTTENCDGITENTDLLVEREIEDKKKGGRPKKIKQGRRPKIDLYADLPPGLSESQKKSIVEKRRIEIRKEQLRQAAKRYREKNPEAHRRAVAKYAQNHREAMRKSSAKYSKSHPEVSRRASDKYAKKHPEVNRRASAKYAEKKRMQKLELQTNANADVKVEVQEMNGSCHNLCVKEEQNIVKLHDTESQNGGSDLTVQLIEPVAMEHSIFGI